MSHLFCPTCSCPIFCLISLGWSNLFSTDFFLIFRSDFMSDFCPIIVRFSMSDLLYPIFLCEFFCPTCSCPIFCPIFFVRFLALFFVRFDVSSFCPIFCALFFGRYVVTFLGVISRQKRSNMSHVLPPLSCTVNVSRVFTIMTVLYHGTYGCHQEP